MIKQTDKPFWTALRHLFLACGGLAATALFNATCPAATIDLTSLDTLTSHPAATGGSILSYHASGAIANGIGSNDSFLELRQSGGSGSEQGYNTDATIQFSTTTLAEGLPLSDVPLVRIDGVNYYEFGLGLNATGGDTQHSLDEFQMFQGNTPNLDNYSDVGPTLSGMSPVFDWLDNNTAANWALLQDDVTGQSNVDYLFYVNASAFDSNLSHVYLYAEMGFEEDADSGEERWVVDRSDSPFGFCASVSNIECTIVPEPTIVSGMGFVFALVILWRRR